MEWQQAGLSFLVALAGSGLFALIARALELRSAAQVNTGNMADRLRDELRADLKTIRVDLKEMTDKNDALRQSVWAIGDKNNSLERQVTALTVAWRARNDRVTS